MATEIIAQRPAPARKGPKRAARPIAEPKPRKEAKPRKARQPRQARQAPQPIEAVRQALELMKPQLALALPPHLPVDRLLRVVITVLQTTPALLDCDRASLYRAVITCAQLGLEPDGVLGQAYLVPSRGKVQLVPGYRGFIGLARNSGLVTSINAQAVHRNDRFEFAYGLNERLEHVPAEGDRGEITHFYAYAKFKDGGHHFDVMSKGEVDAVRDRSESYQAYRTGKIEDSAWVTGYAEMGKKTVIRRIAKFLPLAVQKAAALAEIHESGRTAALDELGEIVLDLSAADAAPIEAPPAPSRLDAFAAPAPKPAPMPKPSTGSAEGDFDPDLEQLLLAFPPHILRILDAIVVHGVPEEALPGIIGMPLEDVPEESAEEILRALAEWEPPLDPFGA